MRLLNLVKDQYSREARLYPALLVLLPLVVSVLAAFPAMRTPAAGLVSLLVAFGALALLTQLGRDRGKVVEARLFAEAGGKPSVAFLRHRDPTLSKLQKARYHDFLTKRLPTPAPSAADEAADPGAADDWYEAGTTWLLARTRDAGKYGLLFQENVSYGFRRNLYGLKRPAQIAGSLALLASVARPVYLYHDTGELPGGEVVGTVLFLAIYLALITFWITPDWVRIPSEGYARRLLEACDTLPSAAAGTAAAKSGRGKARS